MTETDALSSLQSEIDRLVEQDERRLDRIARLEHDRQVLRARLEETRRELDHARQRWWRRSGRTRVPAQAVAAGPTPGPKPSIPGIGAIAPAGMPQGPKRRAIRVATVLDPFSATVLSPEFESVPLPARGWREVIEDQPPALLFVESAYQGVDGSWATRVARFAHPSPALTRLTEWCRSHGIPTVFWNKEDPANFDWFIESAALFDHVFTVDGDQIARYKDRLGHDRVHLLQFFAQPLLHHPPTEAERPGAVAFAGSYFARKHGERRQQIDAVVDAGRDHGLHIFDRHGFTDDARFAWPERYRPHIVGSLTYPETITAYRLYKVFLNVNTVTASSTMCARRVFELAASGTAIVSGPSRAIAHILPPEAIITVGDRSAASQAIGRLLADHELRARMGESARRWVLEGHTAEDRVDSLLRVVGLL